MKKKIGQYLPVAFGAIALVLLLLTAGGKDAPAGTEPPDTTPTVQTEDAPSETETQAAATSAPAGDALSRVEQVLDRKPLDETAMATCIHDADLNAAANTTGLGAAANAHALARLCDEQRMNPIAAFWLLEDASFYSYSGDEDGLLGVGAFDVPKQSRKEYPYSDEGTRELLTDILTLSCYFTDEMHLETRLLGENGRVDADQIFYADGDCYYSYFVCYGDRSAHFLCFYIRGSETIDDVEFQMLNLCYGEGDKNALRGIVENAERQAASMMAAAELLLSGSSRVNEGHVSFGYPGSGFTTDLDRYDVTGSGEFGSLINYAIHLDK